MMRSYSQKGQFPRIALDEKISIYASLRLINGYIHMYVIAVGVAE